VNNENATNNNTTNNSTINNTGTFNNVGQVGNVSGGQVKTIFGSQQATSSPPSGMAGKTQQFDVCIVCALTEEASAVINEFTDRCNGVQFKRAFSKITGYEYKHTVIKNNEGEELTVLIVCMPFTGPTETVNSVRSLLDEFHPRFVAMAGLCAGYEKEVALGDLVAAIYAFHYEEGKVVADEDGQNKLLPEWKTHGTAKRIVQYINNFTGWKAPVIEMKKRKLGRELQLEEFPRCLIAPVASGMAVQANNPFPHLIEHNRKALFLDQEVAAFYQTLNEFPRMYFLAVKGVCDYGNVHKNDDYRDYAARASAIYLLFFIQSYVLDMTMPR
jgi:nucleoside phosphorylase